MESKTKPFFSIVVPCLNEEKHLPHLLEDLSKQTFSNFEIIVIDGLSEDNTIAVAKSFKSKFPNIKVFKSSIRNVSFQRNMGADHSEGTYIIFNDADNRIPSYFLEGVHYQLQVKKYDLFTTWCNPDTNNRSDKTISNYFNFLIETASLLNNPAALGAMIGCRKSIFKSIGGFDRNIGFAEDTEFVNRGHRKGYSFGVFHEPRYNYSLRRFRKIGTIKLIQRYAVLNIKFLTNQKVDQVKEYPMGGAYLEETGNTTPDFIKTIQAAFKKKTKKIKISDHIKALLSLEEDKS